MPNEGSNSEEKEEALRIVGSLLLSHGGRDIYRGQSKKGWTLLPKALRKEYSGGDPLHALKSFRRECWSIGYNAKGDLEDVALAQHYGLATNLLDWTLNPLVALFFACQEDLEEAGKPADGEIVTLNNPQSVSEEEQKADAWQTIEGVKLYNPRLIDARIARQKGLFTVQGLQAKSVEDLVQAVELKKRAVPGELKHALLEVLYVAGIDRSVLFPDADGLSAKINWETRNRIQREFPPVSGSRVVYLQGIMGKVTVSGHINQRLMRQCEKCGKTFPAEEHETLCVDCR